MPTECYLTQSHLRIPLDLIDLRSFIPQAKVRGWGMGTEGTHFEPRVLGDHVAQELEVYHVVLGH